MKKVKNFLILFLLFLGSITAFGQTTILTTGDVILVTLNADGNKNFDFVPLVPLASGTVIKFTDKPWDLSLNGGSGGFPPASTEGILIYTAPNAIGEGVVISYPGSTGGAWSTGGGGFNPSGSGDNILVFQGDTASPTFIYGAGWAKGATVWSYSGSTDSDIPSNLSLGDSTIISLGTSDNYQYNTSNGTFGSKRKLLNIVATSANWSSNNSTAYTTLLTYFDNTDDDSNLPIELLSFNASSNNKKVELNWSTASEINNNYFTIERSLDAENFEIIKTLSGAGNSNSQINYSATDNNPLSGLSYYRLKQTDFNGNYSYSKIVAVESTSENMSLKILNPYSKPNNINFTILNPNLENLSFEIINTLGEVLISSKVENVVNKSSVVINTKNLSHGIYFIKLSSNKETVVEKVLF